MNIGDKILLCRKEIGLSQEQLAAKLNISRQAVSRWETNEAMPDTEKVIQLSRVFQVSTDYLLLEEISNKPAPMTAQKEQLSLTIGKFVFIVGLTGFFATFIGAIFYAKTAMDGWYSNLGKVGTALFHSALTAPLILGLLLTAIGGYILWNAYQRMR